MNNICKFPQLSFHAPLSTSCFVMESDSEVMKKHTPLKDHRILLVIQGQGVFNFNDCQFPFHTGSLFFGFKDEFFSVDQNSDTAYMYIDFSGGRAEELFHRFGIRNNNRCFDGYDGLIPLWRESLSHAHETAIDLSSESILLYTFSRLLSQSKEYNRPVGKILEFTEHNFTDPELSLSRIAEVLSYNPKYISHVFKKAMNLTYSEYLRDLRVKYAISLFNEGLDSVKNVALLSGFGDPLYFSNIFKKNIGISPKEYILSLSKSKERQQDQ